MLADLPRRHMMNAVPVVNVMTHISKNGIGPGTISEPRLWRYIPIATLCTRQKAYRAVAGVLRNLLLAFLAALLSASSAGMTGISGDRIIEAVMLGHDAEREHRRIRKRLAGEHVVKPSRPPPPICSASAAPFTPGAGTWQPAVDREHRQRKQNALLQLEILKAFLNASIGSDTR